MRDAPRAFLMGCWLYGSAALAQMPQPPAVTTTVPKFEAVSIKPCGAGLSKGAESRLSGTPGRLRFECVTVDVLIRNAYQMYPDGVPWRVEPRTGFPLGRLPYAQTSQPIKGSAGWIRTDRFTIDARADRPASLEMMRGPMMQALLKDRFRLKIHREPKEIPVYELTVAPGGAKLIPTKDGTCLSWDPAKPPPQSHPKGQPGPRAMCGGISPARNGIVEVLGTTMENFCLTISQGRDRPVVDKTGIGGQFDLHLQTTSEELFPLSKRPDTPTDPAAPPIASDPGGSLVQALLKLGLKMSPAKMTVEILAIDRAEKPTAN